MEVYITFIEGLGYILDLLSAYRAKQLYFRQKIFATSKEWELWLGPLIQLPIPLYKILEQGWPGIPAMPLLWNGPGDPHGSGRLRLALYRLIAEGLQALLQW